MQFKIGDTVRKTKGSKWQGKIVGQYSTALTPNGYAVESDTETGSVQIYPASALELAVSIPTKKVATMNSQVMIGRELLQELASFCSDSRSYNETMRVLAASAPIPDAGNVAEHLPDSAFQDEFQVWWEEEGQYVRSGGGAYERTFAFQAWRHLMPKLVSALQASAMVVPDGYALVPVEMSDEMHAAYLDQYGRGLGIYWIYKALLAASPAPGGGQ